MRGHNNYILPTIEEKHCHTDKFIYNYMLDHFFNFKQIKRKSNDLYNYFKNNIEFDMTIDVRLKHFREVLKSEKTFEFYLHLNNILFPLIIDLEYIIKNLIKINFSKLYNNFNIGFLDI